MTFNLSSAEIDLAVSLIATSLNAMPHEVDIFPCAATRRPPGTGVQKGVETVTLEVRVARAEHFRTLTDQGRTLSIGEDGITSRI